jgi:hypothetical protein
MKRLSFQKLLSEQNKKCLWLKKKTPNFSSREAGHGGDFLFQGWERRYSKIRDGSYRANAPRFMGYREIRGKYREI